MSALRVQGACFCQRWESNPHDPKGHGILSPARLPIPPLWPNGKANSTKPTNRRQTAVQKNLLSVMCVTYITHVSVYTCSTWTIEEAQM